MTSDAGSPIPPPSPDPAPEAGSPKRHSRRLFLGAAGAGASAAVIAGASGVAGALQNDRRRGDGESGRGGVDGGADDRRRRRDGDGRRDRGDDNAPRSGRFVRMFERRELGRDDLEPMRQALIEVSRPGGILDANDPVEVGPIRLITEPELSPNNLDNPTLTAGNTFFGQFLDHDLTRDAGSRLGRPVGLRRSINLRQAAFDLDSVYGGGPAESPDLYDGNGRFVVESGGQFEDLPRDGSGQAIVADGRNDEHVIISGMHAAFLLFHNAVLDRVEATGVSGDAAFEQARRDVCWHYQWIIVNEYLPGIVGQALVNDIRANGRRHYTPDTARIPVEFQTSAFRFGHSQVRPSYRANLAGDDGEPFFAFVFDESATGDDPDDLRGGFRAPRRFIGWQTFFDFDDGEVRNNKRIDPTISSTLFRLPASAIPTERGEDLGPTSLATRNLLRHLTWEVATGQQVAAEMNVAALTAGDLAQFGEFGGQLDTATPLWLYILREAELVENGERLGPVGGRIVAEVFLGLLDLDDESYVSADPTWRPTLPTRAGDADFRMVDLLTVAGVDPDSRGQ